MPKLVKKNGRFHFEVDGRPYLILGGRIHNSSAWPSMLPQVWEALEAMHANTAEAPVYWEQIENEAPGMHAQNYELIAPAARGWRD